MASQSDVVRGRPETPRGQGVVEDFIALKPEEHAYECVLKHTDNLVRKVRRYNSDVDAMVSQGVIPPLVGILKHKDRRDCARLQHTAVQALHAIVAKAPRIDRLSAINEAGGIPPLLNLLKLRLDVMVIAVLELLFELSKNEHIDIVSSIPGSIEAFIEAMRCEPLEAKIISLKFIDYVLSHTKLPSEKVPGFLNVLFPLLYERDETIVFLTCQVFNTLAEDGDISIVDAMVSTGVLQHFAATIEKAGTTQTQLRTVVEVLSCTRTLARVNKDCNREIMESGFVHVLQPYLKCSDAVTLACNHANWLLANVILHNDDKALDMLVRMSLVPKIWILGSANRLEESKVLLKILPRLLMNSNYSQEFLEPHFLGYLIHLQRSKKWCMLHKLLTVFKIALEKTEEQGKLADLKAAVVKCKSFQRLRGMLNCPNLAVKGIASEVVDLYLK